MYNVSTLFYTVMVLTHHLQCCHSLMALWLGFCRKKVTFLSPDLPLFLFLSEDDETEGSGGKQLRMLLDQQRGGRRTRARQKLHEWGERRQSRVTRRSLSERRHPRANGEFYYLLLHNQYKHTLILLKVELRQSETFTNITCEIHFF